MRAKPAFVREATGLVRELSWIDGFVLNISQYNVPLAFFGTYFFGLFLVPGADLALTLSALSLLINIPFMIVYSMFGASMPKSGGDYVFATRSLFPALGFATAVGMWIYIFQAIGGCAWASTTYFVAPGLSALGYMLPNQALSNFATILTQPIPTLILGCLFIAIGFFFATIPISGLRKVLTVLFVIAFLGYPVLYSIVLASSSHSQFVAAFDSYAIKSGMNTTYASVISSAKASGATILPLTLGGSLAGLPWAYSSLGSSQCSTYWGGETKRASRNLPLSLITSVLAIAVVMGVMGYLSQGVFGSDFLQATMYFWLSGAKGNPFTVAPLMSYLAAILFPDPVFNIFMFISMMCWIVIIFLILVTMGQRLLFAWAFDRMLPSALADVNDRFHTPIKAAIVTAILGVCFFVPMVYALVPTEVSYLAIFLVAYILVMVAGIVYPFGARALFEQSPSFVKKRIASVPVMSLFGVLGAAGYSIVLLYLIGETSISGITPASIGVVVATYVLAVVIYYVVRAYRRREGIDLDFIYKQIPPD
jgi:amino acid transporter